MQRFFLAFAIALSTHDDCYREFRVCSDAATTVAAERECRTECVRCMRKVK